MLRFLSGLIIIASFWNSVAAAPLRITDERGSYALSTELNILEDVSNNIKIDDILADNKKFKFQPCRTGAPDFSFSESTFWIKFELLSGIQNLDTVILELEEFFNLGTFTIFYKTPDGNLLTRNIGFDEIHYRNRAIYLPLRYNTVQTFYIKVKTTNRPLEIPMHIWTTRSFTDKTVFEYALIAFFFGIIILLMIINITVGSFLKDKTFLYFALFLFISILHQMWFLGFINQFVVQVYDINIKMGMQLWGMLILALLLFSITFIKTEVFPHIRKIQYLIAAGGCVLIIASLIDGGPQLADRCKLVGVIFTLYALLFLINGFYSIKQFLSSELFFTAGIITLIAAYILHVMEIHAVLPYKPVLEYTIQIGLLLQVSFFSMALASKIRIMRSERYASELELKQMWDSLDGAFKAGLVGLWDFNIADKTLRINSRMSEILGLKSNFITDADRGWKNFTEKDDFFSPAGTVNNFLKQISQKYTDEYQVVMPDGRNRWFFYQGKNVVYNVKGKPLRAAGSIIDITKQKESETKRIKLELKIQQTQKLESLGLLAGGIAHDFNNILAGILGKTEMLLYQLQDESELQQGLLDIKKSVIFGRELTGQMLIYSGKKPSVIENINLSNLIIEMNSLLKSSVSKSVKMSYYLQPEIPEIKGDAAQLKQIIMNFVINGSDAIENNGTIDVTTSSLYLTPESIESLTINLNVTEGNFVLLEISDSGCGIPEEKLKKIFDPFFTTKITGRGLGLAVVSGIIINHNAGLLIKSNIGEGTSFKVYFPVSQ